MKDYQIRDGIVLKNICGEWLLVAVGEASEHCMYVRRVNDTLAFFWQHIVSGKTFEQIIADAAEEYDASEDQLGKDLQVLIGQLCKAGYLIANHPDDEENDER